MQEKFHDQPCKEPLLNQEGKKDVVGNSTQKEVAKVDIIVSRSLNIETQDSENAKVVTNDQDISLTFFQKLKNKCNRYHLDEDAESNYSILYFFKFT